MSLPVFLYPSIYSSPLLFSPSVSSLLSIPLTHGFFLIFSFPLTLSIFFLTLYIPQISPLPLSLFLPLVLSILPSGAGSAGCVEADSGDLCASQSEMEVVGGWSRNHAREQLDTYSALSYGMAGPAASPLFEFSNRIKFTRELNELSSLCATFMHTVSYP